MTIRFTLAEKWQDKWFRTLTMEGKLLFLYMCDSCNIAGIWEIDLEQAAFSIGAPTGAIEMAYRSIEKGYEKLNETHIWIWDFLNRQRNIPLNPKTAAHATIINQLLPYKDLSENILQLLSSEAIKELTRGLQAPISISISKGKGKSVSKGISKRKKEFVPPALEELREYITQNKYDVDAEKFLKFFTESGWIDSNGKPVLNWKQKIITWSGNRNGKRQEPAGTNRGRTKEELTERELYR